MVNSHDPGADSMDVKMSSMIRGMMPFCSSSCHHGSKGPTDVSTKEV
jgi:hypothetical protein